MAFRKLIKFGKSSYVISIPTDWIKKNELEKGDTVYLDEENDNLVIRLEQKKHKKQFNKIDINITGKDDKRIEREIVAAHLNNYKIITLTGSGLKEKSAFIRSLIHKLMALELIEQTSNRIIIEDFLDVQDVNIYELIRKMDLITRTMLTDTKEFIGKKTEDTITYRDEDVNRINFVLIKLIKAALRDPSLLQSLKLTSIQCYTYWRVAYYIEKSGDEIKAIVRLLKNINLDNNSKKELLKIFNSVEDFYNKTMISLYNRNTNLAFALSDKKQEINVECEKFLNNKWNKRYMPNLIERIRNLVRHIHGILREVYA